MGEYVLELSSKQSWPVANLQDFQGVWFLAQDFLLDSEEGRRLCAQVGGTSESVLGKAPRPRGYHCIHLFPLETGWKKLEKFTDGSLKILEKEMFI